MYFLSSRQQFLILLVYFITVYIMDSAYLILNIQGHIKRGNSVRSFVILFTPYAPEKMLLVLYACAT